jgi:hypothetical protein
VVGGHIGEHGGEAEGEGGAEVQSLRFRGQFACVLAQRVEAQAFGALRASAVAKQVATAQHREQRATFLLQRFPAA